MKYIYTLSLALIFSLTIQAQEKVFSEGDQVKITTSDGNQYKGEIIEINDEKVVIRSESKVDITIKHNDIIELAAVSIGELEMFELDNKDNPIDFHNSTFYSLTPSAFGLKKGQSIYKNVMHFIHTYSYGLADNFSLTVGGEVWTFLSLGIFPTVSISPKFSFPVKNTNVIFSLGGTLYTTPRDRDFDPFGFSAVANGAITLGGRNKNITFGTGFGFDFQFGIKESIVPFYISGMIPIESRMSLVMDYMLFTSYRDNELKRASRMLSFSLRYRLKNSTTTINAGFVALAAFDGLGIAIPHIAMTIALDE